VRRLGWITPAALAALVATVLAAVLVARGEKPSRALQAATPGILSSGHGTPPEIAAINAQLAQIAALHAGALYGPGLTKVVHSPVAGLRPLLGEEWRELSRAVGRVLVRPTGPPSRYFEVGMVAVASGPGQLRVLTSEGQQVSQAVGQGGPFQLINVGPLLAPPGSSVGLALSSTRPGGRSPGPTVLISPLQAEYLAPGQAAMSMRALAEIGPGGQRGSYLAAGSATRFAMTPGVAGPAYLAIRGAAFGRSLPVAVTVGGEARSGTADERPGVTYIGPFAHTAEVVAISVPTPAQANASLFVSDIRFVPQKR
jgi:hypothetical protein